MNTTPITEDDIKALRKSTSKSLCLTTRIVIPFVVVFLIAVGTINLYFCARLSDMAGMSMTEVIRGWFAGIDPSAHYSGSYIKAQERWVTGITQFALAGIGAIMFAVRRRAAKRDEHILRFIEEKSI